MNTCPLMPATVNRLMSKPAFFDGVVHIFARKSEKSEVHYKSTGTVRSFDSKLASVFFHIQFSSVSLSLSLSAALPF
jgi:hypothetical protein